MIVVDTHVLAYLFIPGPFTAKSETLLRLDPAWAAPPLWRSELRNVLVNHTRAGHATRRAALAVMERAEELLAEHTMDISTPGVIDLAARSHCSAYDCEFIALATGLGVPLVTCDRKLARAFPGVARLLDQLVDGKAGAEART